MEKFDFKFTKEEVDLIFNSLTDQPFKLVHQLVQNISTQFNTQAAFRAENVKNEKPE